MRSNWTKSLAIMVTVTALTSCATSKEELLPHGGRTMQDIWQQESSNEGSLGQMSHRQLLDARQSLRRPFSHADVNTVSTEQESYTRTAANDVRSQFQRLPNPDLLMYVFPHLAGTDPVPVPGYTTIFPLYQRVQYAMPGERTEDY